MSDIPLQRSRAAWLGAVFIFLSSCSTADRVSGPDQAAPPLAADRGLLGSVTSLLACPATPGAQAEETIGPEGGTLQIGPHRLVVPPGALDTLVTISGVAVADSVVSVQFQPEGLTFSRPARLTLSYAACPLIPSLLPKRIVYTTDALELLELLVSSDDLLHLKLSANLDHFSRYAVAW
jgi:hypothetical protein